MRKTSGATTLAAVGEAGLLRLIARRFGAAPGIVVGVGDDAAVVRRVAPDAVISTDMLVEGVDFAFPWATATDVGHKAAAVNLSDLAAMGARPRALVAALALRPTDRVRDILALLTALDAAGRRYGAPLCGGDLSATRGPLVVSVTALGEVATKQALRRHRGRPGDVVLVSGTLGAAAAGLGLLQRDGRAPRGLARAQLRPEPRVALGLALLRWGKARSVADLSDGLVADALHLAAPGAGVVIEVEQLPVAPAVKAAAASLRVPWWRLALAGGEDFELAVAVRRPDVEAARGLARRLGLRLTEVGRVVRGKGVRVVGVAGTQLAGFDHFARR